MDVLTTCPHCFKNKNNTPSCPNCGYITGNEKHTDVIKPFTVMENRYLMGNVLGRGGFGVTYVAYDKFAEKICAIKEYMPQEYAVRDENTNYIKPTNQKSAEIFNHGKMRFIDEAKILYKLEKTYAVVKFLGLFEANNTAYLVMEYLDGVNLKRLVNSYGGKIPIPLANEVLVTVASTMMEIHKYGILHRDITPENIYITREGAVKLIDFGAARNYLTAQNNGMSVFLKPGFAPPEQYSSKGEQGKYTDVYAVAAVYYNIVSGKKIPDALYRVRGEKLTSLYELNCGVSKKNSDAIDKALSLNIQDRFQDFSQFLSAMDFSNGSSLSKSGQSSETTGGKSQHLSQNSQSGSKNRAGYMNQADPHDLQEESVVKSAQGIHTNSNHSAPSGSGGLRAGQVPASGRNSGGRYNINSEQSAQKVQKNAARQYSQGSTASGIRTNTNQGNRTESKGSFFGRQSSANKRGIPCVTVVNGACRGRSMRFHKKQAIKIGKQYRENDFVIDQDTSISRVHCSVWYDKKRRCFFLKDENSTNGTFLENGARLDPSREYMLYPGDKFYLSQFSNMIQVTIE